MKKIIWTLIAVIGLVQYTTAQEITLEDIWQKRTFSPIYVSGFNFLKDGKHYTKKESTKEGHIIVKYDLASGNQVENVFEGSALTAIDSKSKGFFGSYSFSEDEQKMLIATNTESIYRHSSKSNFYVYDRGTKKFSKVSPAGKQSLATLSPDATKVAYILNNNIYMTDLKTGDRRELTHDGESNKIINGQADWVYEEEFGQDRAFYWSPDGTKIAYLKFDESAVKEFSMTYYNNDLYPDYESFKYPKAGEKNADVSVHVYDIATGKSTKIETGNRPTEDIYFPRIKWTQDANTLCITRMNRHQNALELLLADATTGKTSKLLVEKNGAYVDLHDNLTFLKDGKHFIWTSEERGFNHIYLYDMEGNLVRPITKGEYDVTAFYGINEQSNTIFYQAAAKSPLRREIYSINLEGKDKKELSKESGTNSAWFSGTFDYFVNVHSAFGVPNSYVVRNKKGKSVRNMEMNGKLIEKMEKYNFSKGEFIKVPTEEYELNGYMIKPPNFDANKKYPVFMYVYGGPGSQTVKDAWGGSNYLWFQMLAQKGYIVVSVDNRGTGARGEGFKKMTYKELGKYETIDQINAAKHLGKLGYVDASRIGIFGWSYGGYMSSLCLFKGNDVFKSAIAVAPVTNWKWYDSIYTERYMRTPAENESGYEENSPINHVDKLKGNYLLVHGITDDNVHFQNTAEMASALIKANKQFDTYFYPNRNHGIYGNNARMHLYTKMTNFVLEKL